MNNRIIRKIYIYIFTIIVILIVLIFSILWYYENRFFSRNIQFQSISQLEKELNEEFHINKLVVKAKRGWHCYFIIHMDESSDENNYDKVHKMIEYQLNQDLANEIIVYARNNYTWPLIPKEERFYVIILVNKDVVYRKNLIIKESYNQRIL